MLIDSRERGREEERERNIDVREKYRSLASRIHPRWGPSPQPRHVSWLGIEPVTFQFTGWHCNQLSHTSQGSSSFLHQQSLAPHLVYGRSSVNAEWSDDGTRARHRPSSPTLIPVKCCIKKSVIWKIEWSLCGTGFIEPLGVWLEGTREPFGPNPYFKDEKCPLDGITC